MEYAGETRQKTVSFEITILNEDSYLVWASRNLTLTTVVKVLEIAPNNLHRGTSMLSATASINAISTPAITFKFMYCVMIVTIKDVKQELNDWSINNKNSKNTTTLLQKQKENRTAIEIDYKHPDS